VCVCVCARLQHIGEAHTISGYNEAVASMRNSDTWSNDESVREYVENTWMPETKASILILLISPIVS